MSTLSQLQQEALLDREGLEQVFGEEQQTPDEAAATPEIRTTRGDTVSRTTQAAPLIDTAIEFARLDQKRQALAYVGHLRPISLRTLPKNSRALTLTTRRNQMHQVEDALASWNLSRPVGTQPTYSALDPFARQQLIVPAAANAMHMLHHANRQGLNIALSIVDAEALSLRVGTTQTIVNPHLHSSRNIDSDNTDSAQLTILDATGNPTTYKDANLSQPARFWAPAPNSGEAINSAKEQDYNLPESLNGNCQYLVIDPNLLLNIPANLQHLRPILNQIIALSSSPDYFTTADESGNIIIINLSPRGGSYIEMIADSLHRATNEQLSLFTGRGEIHRISGEKFTITNYPTRKQFAEIKEAAAVKPQIFSRANDVATNRAGRDSTTTQSTATPADGLPGIVTLSDISAEVKLHVGAGPRDFIGYKREFAQLKKATSFTEKAKLILLKGQAGLGKSRMLHEWQKENPNAMVLSIDSAGEKVPGHSLVTVATQIARQLKSKLSPEQLAQNSGSLDPLLEFAEKDEPGKLTISNTEAYKITNMCTAALLTFEKVVGRFHLLIDDIHHTDPDSDSEVMRIVKEFLTEANGSKAIISMRPEERFKSRHQKTLEQDIETFGNNAVEEISLEFSNGKPKLNLQDPDIAYAYITSSLPEEWLINRRGEPRKLINNWHLKLVGTPDSPKARTPLDLTTLLNILLRNKRNFILTDDGIELKDKPLQMLENLKNSEDIAREEKRRLQMLKKTTKTLLYGVALLGRKVTQKQLAKLGGITSNQGATMELREGKYLFLEEDGYRLQHDTTRSNILDSIPPKDKQVLALQIFEMFKDDPAVHADVKFALLQHCANQAKESDINFWRNYCKTAENSLEDAKATNSFGRAFSLSNTILDDLNPKSKSTISQYMKKAEKGEHLPPSIRKLIADSLLAVAENGSYLGQRKKVYTAITLLETLGADEKTLQKAYLAGFTAAYMPESEPRKMQEFSDKLTDIDNDERKLIDIRLAYKKATDKPDKVRECLSTFPDNELVSLKTQNPQAFKEFQRLYERISLETTRLDLVAANIDEDTIMSPGLMDEQTTASLLRTKARLLELHQTKRTSKAKLKPVEELFLAEQLAQTSAFLGHYRDALENFSELWRIANQMEIHELAARAAKLKGDIEMILAISEITAANYKTRGSTKPLRGGTILREHVLDGIETYTEQGLRSAQLTPENKYNSILHTQRLRAVATLALSYKLELSQAIEQQDTQAQERIKQELLPYIQIGIIDFNFLNFKSPWKNLYEKDTDGELSYYINPSIGHILTSIQLLGLTEADLKEKIPTKSSTEYPSMSNNVIELGKTRAQRMRDFAGDVQRKKDGFDELDLAA